MFSPGGIGVIAGARINVAPATFNPSDIAAGITLSNVNRTMTLTSDGSQLNARGNKIVSSGKWYFEFLLNVWGGNTTFIAGVANSSHSLTATLGSDANGWGYIGNSGNKIHNGSNTAHGSSISPPTGYVSVALDMDAGKIWFGPNGTYPSSGDPAAGTNEAFSGLSGSLMPAVNRFNTGDQTTLRANASDCSSSAPSGFEYLDAA